MFMEKQYIGLSKFRIFWAKMICDILVANTSRVNKKTS